MNLETKITIYKFTPQVFTLTRKNLVLQLRALRLPIAGRTARRWKPYGSQLQNGIYQEL